MNRYSKYFTRLILLCILLTFSVSCKKVEKIETSGQDMAISVMSFNIRYGTAPDGENDWTHRHERVFQLIKSYQPDVIGLQEALEFQLQQLLTELPEYEKVGVGRDDGAKKGEYAAILYKKDKFKPANGGTFWFSDTPEQPGSTSWGNTIPRICTWVRLRESSTDAFFYVYNVHLDHESQVSRERSALYLTQRINQRQYPDPVIATGDFNAGKNNIVTRFMQGEVSMAVGTNTYATNEIPLSDSYSHVHPQGPEIGTYHGFKGGTDGDRIDYIFYSKGFKPGYCDILTDSIDGRYPSDHYPVQAELILKIYNAP